MPAESGVNMHMIRNQVLAIQSSTLAMRLGPIMSRKARAPTAGAIAVPTRARGLSFASSSRENTPGVYLWSVVANQVILGRTRRLAAWLAAVVTLRGTHETRAAR